MAKSLVYCFLSHGVHIKFSLARLTNITSIFTLQSYQSMRGLGYKIYLPECRTDARKFFFGQRVIHTWNSLKLSPASMSTLLSMTSSYLSSRCCRVKCETELSSWHTSSCSVPKALSLVHYSSSCTPLLSVPSFPLVS